MSFLIVQDPWVAELVVVLVCFSVYLDGFILITEQLPYGRPSWGAGDQKKALKFVHWLSGCRKHICWLLVIGLEGNKLVKGTGEGLSDQSCEWSSGVLKPMRKSREGFQVDGRTTPLSLDEIRPGIQWWVWRRAEEDVITGSLGPR